MRRKPTPTIYNLHPKIQSADVLRLGPIREDTRTQLFYQVIGFYETGKRGLRDTHDLLDALEHLPAQPYTPGELPLSYIREMFAGE